MTRLRRTQTRRHHPLAGPMITVVCAECTRTQGSPVTAEFTNTDEARAFIRRHHAFADHRAHVEEIAC
ncbi:hypothetical protein PBI_SISI_64 [Mycobacterium phage SiSi]|uniref:Uncharacterized protein n=6 Tax=Gracegardnervirinae TaxID=2946632 RepID=R4JMI7_9CAUD|nr:hypothetical protein BOOMER_71 [Mycobacterium phage Boomer]YP_008051190.1 hypothetical protein M040_gp64 [Mycobacterium phage SiSi]ACF34133.1 hypothetical protein BOOMER_71 [Mycobacterium phage Boomer]AGK87900.1 hypothetical protein PBI_SISI_64 [Mycobacterium phage SiSi]